MSNRIGFIGCGNMGSTLARAVAKSELLNPAQISLANRTVEKADELAKELGGQMAANTDIAKYCQYIFLGVKPQMMKSVLEEIGPILKQREERVILVTMAAGLSISNIREMAGGNYPVIRIMPNTPAAIGEGMVLYCSSKVSDEEMVFFLHMTKAVGMFDALPEQLIDAGSAVSGCGPAFVYAFIEALADGGCACGLPRGKALTYAAQMTAGAAQMVLESGRHPGELKDMVCSPAGSTIQGVRTLENGGFRGTTMEAVIAAYDRTLELGNKDS